MVSDFAFYLHIMATYQIPAPSPVYVKGDVPENWKHFKNSWEYYVIATDLRSKLDNDEGKEIVAATLCTVMGAICKRILNSLPSLSAEDKKDPSKIVQELKKPSSLNAMFCTSALYSIPLYKNPVKQSTNMLFAFDRWLNRANLARLKTRSYGTGS